MHTTVGLTAYRRGVIESLRGWTTALEIAYRSDDVASVRSAQDALDRLTRGRGDATARTRRCSGVSARLDEDHRRGDHHMIAVVGRSRRPMELPPLGEMLRDALAERGVVTARDQAAANGRVR